MKTIGLILLLGVASWPASSALACSGPNCARAYPDAGSLPANMQRLRFRAGSARAEDGGNALPRLFRLDGSTKVSLPFDVETIDYASVWVQPREPQAVGSTLVLEFDQGPGCSSTQSTYTVSEAKPLPAKLGSLSSTAKQGALDALARGGSCSEQVDAAYVDLRVELDAEAQPYASLFSYQTYVDGQLQERFRSSFTMPDGLPQGEDRVFTLCKPSLDVAPNEAQRKPGTHNVRFEATLPDGTKLSTPELSITLGCERDAGTIDWSTGAAPADASTPASNTSADNGCALSSHHSSWSGILVALALLLRRRLRS